MRNTTDYGCAYGAVTEPNRTRAAVFSALQGKAGCFLLPGSEVVVNHLEISPTGSFSLSKTAWNHRPAQIQVHNQIRCCVFRMGVDFVSSNPSHPGSKCAFSLSALLLHYLQAPTALDKRLRPNSCKHRQTFSPGMTENCSCLSLLQWLNTFHVSFCWLNFHAKRGYSKQKPTHPPKYLCFYFIWLRFPAHLRCEQG